MKRNDGEEGSWQSVVGMIVLCTVLFIAIKACQAPKREACEARNGVWLARESACVAKPG